MAKRGISAIALALIGVLALAGVAGAATQRLGTHQAKKLAHRLAEKQVRKRHVVSYHLLAAKHLGRNKVAFAYDDRTRSNVYCTATIVVTRTVSGDITRMRATFRGQQCDKIPTDALAFEGATRQTVRALRGTALDTETSLHNLASSLKRCNGLDVPRSRRAAVAAVVDIATVEALENPNDSVLGDFVTALGQIDTPNTVLKNGAAAWGDYLAVVRSLPAIPDPCATLQQWAQAGWAESETPIDLAAYAAANKQATADQLAIARAARYLASVGVVPRTAVEFTPKGLLLRLSPKLPATGGNGKAQLHRPALL